MAERAFVYSNTAIDSTSNNNLSDVERGHICCFLKPNRWGVRYSGFCQVARSRAHAHHPCSLAPVWALNPRLIDLERGHVFESTPYADSYIYLSVRPLWFSLSSCPGQHHHLSDIDRNNKLRDATGQTPCLASLPSCSRTCVVNLGDMCRGQTDLTRSRFAIAPLHPSSSRSSRATRPSRHPTPLN